MDAEQKQFPMSGSARIKLSSDFLGISVSTFYNYIKQGLIEPPKKHGARISYHDAEYIRSLQKNGIGKV